MKIRIAYFEAQPGQDDVSTAYDVDLAEGERVISVERVLDGGYNTDWYRVFIEAA